MGGFRALRCLNIEWSDSNIRVRPLISHFLVGCPRLKLRYDLDIVLYVNFRRNLMLSGLEVKGLNEGDFRFFRLRYDPYRLFVLIAASVY